MIDPAFQLLFVGIAVYLAVTLSFCVRMAVVFLALYAIYNPIKDRPAIMRWAYWPLRCAALVFLVFDVILNWAVTPILLDAPHWPAQTVSERLGHYLLFEKRSAWRYKFAKFWCRILDRGDPDHCRRFGNRNR